MSNLAYEINSSYKSNPLLKPAGTKHSYTKDEIDEFIRCKQNPIYFIENYVKVVHPDKGLVKMKLFDYQKKMVVSFWKQKQTICLTARQIGKSTVVAAFFCWLTIFQDEMTCAILANKFAVAKEIMSRYQKAYENLPKFLQQGVVAFNRMSVELENGSRIFASSTSSSAIRGFTINFLYLDEYAFVGQNVAEDFFTSVWPTLSSGKNSKIIITSTPSGFNHFYKLWNEAEQGINGFNPIFVHWSDHPDRDEAWKQEQLRVLGEDRFAQEMEAEFLGSANTLIPSRDIKKMSADKPVHISEGLKIYSLPIKFDPNVKGSKAHQYVIVCDPSRGTGNDNSAFVIFDVSNYPIRIAAAYSDSNVSPLVLPTILERMAKSYNNAHVLIELNDNGEQVSTILWNDLEYENVVVFEKKRGQRPLEHGVRTTTKVKAQGCTLFKDMVASDKIVINDLDLIYEISNFIKNKNSYKAAPGYYDDLTMCCVLFAWFATSEEYSNLSNTNYKREILKQKQEWIKDDVLPFGFVNNGMIEMDEEELAFWGPGVTWNFPRY